MDTARVDKSTVWNRKIRSIFSFKQNTGAYHGTSA